MVSILMLWLGVLSFLDMGRPATAGWLSQSFFPGSALFTKPTRSHVSKLRTQNHTFIASAGSILRANDQCGGAGGLCNTTSIGIPCGDKPWIGSTCPVNFVCQREDEDIWRCKLIPGRTPGREQLPYMQPSRLPNYPSNLAQQPQQYSKIDSEQSIGDSGPVVPVCGPVNFRGRNTAMCNRTTDGFFVNSTEVPTSAAGVGLSAAHRNSLTVLLRLVLLLIILLTNRGAFWS